MSYLGLMSSPMPNKMLFKVSRISQSTVQVGEIRDSFTQKAYSTLQQLFELIF